MTLSPLLLIPGLLNDARLWQYQLPALSKATSTTIARVTEHDSIESLAADAIAHAPAGQFSLAGFSMGGYIALEIMRQAPERVVALALIDTTARPDTSETKEARLESISTAKIDFDAVIQSFPPKVIHPSRQNDMALVNTIIDMCHTVGVEAFIRQQRAIMNRIDSRPFLSGIRCPTLILCGREDLLTPLPLHQELAEAISGSKFVIVEKCGHVSPLGQPQQVTESMLDWLATTGSHNT